MKGILITGVSGFIGKGLVKALHKTPQIKLFGHSRNPARARADFNEYNIEIVENYDARLLNELGIHSVIHLAGIAHDLSDQYKPKDYYQVNYEGTRLLYDEFLRSGASKFIFLSSIKAAVDVASSSVDETVTPSPVSDYGKSKFLAESYIQGPLLPSHKKYYILRPCMIHGPGNKGNLNLLYKYVKSGMPFPFGAFHNQRSFLSVDNLNFIIRNIIEGDIEKGVYHLADDGFLSTTELFTLIATALGKKPTIWRIPKGLIRVGFGAMSKSSMLNKLTEDMMVSNYKILKQLKNPLPVSIKDGLKRTISFFNEN